MKGLGYSHPPPPITHKIQRIGDSLGGYFIHVFACQDFGYPSFKNVASCSELIQVSQFAEEGRKCRSLGKARQQCHPKCYNNKLFLTFSSFKIYASIKRVSEIINHKASHQTIFLVPGN